MGVTNNTSGGGRQPAVAHRARKGRYPCGVCGSVEKMTKSQVPPQCSGNTDAVTRSMWMAHNSRVELGRPDQGGVWFRGLCRKCNTAAGQFDTAYAHLADILRPLRLASLNQSSPQDQATPHDPIRPGAVARSIMLGMCATTPIIRFNWPQVRQLLSSKRVQLPDQYRLYLAAAQGRSAWVSGTIAGHYSNANTTMNSPAVMMSMSAVFFPPTRGNSWPPMVVNPNGGPTSVPGANTHPTARLIFTNSSIESDSTATHATSRTATRIGSTTSNPTCHRSSNHSTSPGATPTSPRRDDASCNDDWFQQTKCSRHYAGNGYDL